MNNKLSGWTDTIVAPVTAPGFAAIAVIRISGEKAFEIIDRVFLSKKISEQPANTLHVGFVNNGEEDLDEVVVSVFRSPRSFTGEDIIEISCHGSPYVQQQIIDLVISKGARLARAGEFTQRGFLNGKMDLTQAEAVADIISSETAAAHKAALQNIRGGFSHELKFLREQLISFAALIELELDFATEDVEFADRKKFYDLIGELSAAVHRLIDSFKSGNAIKNGVSVAIIGKPNAGKSTLLNVLLNEDRAIVSEIAGTTRDTIEEILNIQGIQFRLIDTAGIRGHSIDAIENIGIEKSLSKMRSADIVLYIFDINNESDEDLQKQAELFETENIKFLLIGNKADLSANPIAGNDEAILISAKTKKGVEELKSKIYSAVIQENTGGIVITNSRHLESLKKIAESLLEIKNGLDISLPGDLLSPDIRTALYHLGEITGEVTNEDKLDFIFSKFCIGK